MRAVAVMLAALLWQSSGHLPPQPMHFRYQRSVVMPPGADGPVCAALDGAVYQHSRALSDVRLFAGSGATTAELPYAKLTSQAADSGNVTIKPLNLTEHGGRISFDLPMPPRPYSTISLNLGGQDFIGSATVTGLQSETCCRASGGTALGTFTIYDLTSQQLGRSTALALSESTFPVLHIELTASPASGHSGFKPATAMVDGAVVPPSRQAQILYTTVAETSNLPQMTDQTIAIFQLPAHVPVERVRFELEPGDHTNFSRRIHLAAQAMQDGSAPSLEEVVDGVISHVQLTQAGREIRQETLTIPATLGSNGRSQARVQISVEAGARPLPIRSIKLEMRERSICFDATTSPMTMYYGDEALTAPAYDYSRRFHPGTAAATARLGPEEQNPLYAARVEHLSFRARHPELKWIAALAFAALLALVGLRFGRHRHRS